MTETSDLLIFWVVVAARFFVPLLIPRYPLPAILAALIIDAADQTIFQQFTNLDLEGYQGYDKALDIYYLTIAYISTLRNWTNLFAFQVSRFLFYWRLVGVVLFELLHLRPLLMIFPNTFEYFFIFYEAVRLRWDPKQMTKKFLIGAAAFIWIFIKLPQEYWIHIAQLDTTDFIKQTIFGMPTDTPWSEILAANLWVIPVLAVVVVLILVLARWILRRLPPADWGLRIAADPVPAPSSGGNGGTDMDTQSERFFNAALLEKIVMVSLFAFLLPPACMCYAPVPPPDELTRMSMTPTPTTFTSPLSPLPTPTPTPTPTPEARHLLLQRLLAEGRLPHDAVHELEV